MNISTFLKNPSNRKFPVSTPYTWHDDLASFLKKNDLPTNIGTATVYAMYGSVIFYLEGKKFIPSCTMGGVNYKFSDQLPDDAKDGEITIAIFTTTSLLVNKDFQKAFTYVLDLSGAAQVSALNEKNVESYFASTGVELNIAPIMKAIPFFAATLDNLSSMPEYQEKILELDWLKYHTTYASGNGLVMKVLEATGTTTNNPGPFKVPATVVSAVEAAIKAPWDKGASDSVPMTLKGVSHVYLEAIGMLPTAKWYQGEKGKSNLSVAAIAAIRAYATTTTRLKANVDAITAAKTIADADRELEATGAIPSII